MVVAERNFKKCFRVIFKYNDRELHEKRESEYFFRNLKEVSDWLNDTILNMKIIDSDFYGSREDLQITVREIYISERKYFVYFKD